MSRRHTHLWSEIQVYPDSGWEHGLLALTIGIIVIALALIMWNPDVEAIGAKIYERKYDVNRDGEVNITDLSVLAAFINNK